MTAEKWGVALNRGVCLCSIFVGTYNLYGPWHTLIVFGAFGLLPEKWWAK